MELPDLSKLEVYYQKVEIIQATADQIIKDFQWFDEQITFSGQSESAYQELYDQIHPIIDRMLNLDAARFFSLLYAIDVEEGKVQKLLFGEEATDASAEIAKLIIRRELIKVILRKHFSKGAF
ncbi:MAG: hypothetical protein RIC95_14365 [Vicingaceae bacterium]